MVDRKLLVARGTEERLPFDEFGHLLVRREDLWFSQIGQQISPMWEKETGPEPILKSDFFKALQSIYEQETGHKWVLGGDEKLLVHFQDLKRKANLDAWHLIHTKDGHILNIAILVDLIDQGKDPKKNRHLWQRRYKEYAAHNIDRRTNANYVDIDKRDIENRVKVLLDHNLPDDETRHYFHFAIATTLIGLVRIKDLFITIGLQNTGKSIVFHVGKKMFGSYAVEISTGLLKPGERKELEKTFRRVMHARMYIFHELPKQIKVSESFLKEVTGGTPLQNQYKLDDFLDFIVEGKIHFDTNHPLVPEDGDQSDIWDRIVIFKYGTRPIPSSERDGFLLDKLTTQQSLDTYFSWLIDTYAYDVFYGRKPKMSAFMVSTKLYYLAKDQPIVFFVRKFCILMGTYVASDLQPRTISQTYTFFFYALRNYQVKMMEKLGLNYDDEGNVLSAAKLRERIRLPTMKEFKDSFDRIVKTPTPDVDRTAKGLGYKTVYIKEPLLCWSLSPEVENIFGGFESFLSMLDNIQEVEDSVLALRAIPKMYSDMVRHARKRITESTAIVLRENDEAVHEPTYTNVDTIMNMMLVQNLLPSGTQDAVEA